MTKMRDLRSNPASNPARLWGEFATKQPATDKEGHATKATCGRDRHNELKSAGSMGGGRHRNPVPAGEEALPSSVIVDRNEGTHADCGRRSRENAMRR